MDGYNGGYGGYLGAGFTNPAGDGQHEASPVEQNPINIPYTQQLNLPSEQEILQSYPHLRHTIGHEFQSPVSPIPTQNTGIPRFPLPFPQLGSFPGFQNPELLQQILDLQQISSSRQQNVGNYGSIMSNYLHPSHSYMGHSVPNLVGNLQLAPTAKSPVDLHCSPAPSPARTSPDFSSYPQTITSYTPTTVPEANTASVIQNQYSVTVPNSNQIPPVASMLHETYQYKVKQEPLNVPHLQSAFPGAQTPQQPHDNSVKIPDVYSDNTQELKNDNTIISERLVGVVPENTLSLEQNENACIPVGNENQSEVIALKHTVATLNSKTDKDVEDIDSEMSIDGRQETFVDRNNLNSERQFKVKFFCLGNLSKSSTTLFEKRPREVLAEVVDCEERIFTDIILNLSVKKEHIEKMQAVNVLDKAEGNNLAVHAYKSEEETARQSEDTDNEMDNHEFDDTETNLVVNDYDADESHIENSVSFDSIGIQDNWYSAAMKKYAELNGEASPEVATAKKGGRSDPDNPFAITSPSFSESAARALVVTTNSENATFVMVSIMSIGSRMKLIPKLVDSAAAKGGIVSVVNPGDTADSKPKENDSENNGDLSKLDNEKETEMKQGDDNAIDRLDISIKIDDDQFLSHGEHKRWQCKLCTKSYTTKHNLVSHILDHCSIKPHLCLVCGKYFKQLSHLNTHMLTHDNVKPHVCEVCNKGFTQISHLKRHQTVHCDSKPYICDICNRGFAYPSELRIHKDKHIPGKDKCVDCGVEFPNVKELREHMILHEHGNRLDLTCQHCDKAFRFPSQLRDHMMTHVGSRPYMCTECGMDFMKEHHLKAHQFTHTGLRPFACPYCSRSFNQKANMVRHILIHNAQRAFKCEVCGKTFTQPQTLKAHMVVHADKKPYSCKYCGKQFGRLHNLQGHLHIHNNTKPYACSICGSSFTLKGNLNRHKKVKHGLNESMESMEEDAVNFLGNLSDRMQDLDSSHEDQEISKDESAANDGKSPKKGRKSIPRKRISRLSGNEGAETIENGHEGENVSEDENERSNELTYSEEERENEERLNVEEGTSRYFEKSDYSDSSRRKRKQEVSYRIEDISEDYGNHSEDEGKIQHPEFRIQSSQNNTHHKEQLSENLSDQLNVKTNEINDNADYDEDTETEIENYEIKTKVPKKRSVRKRKRKCLAEGFVGDNFDDEIEGWSPQPTKVRKKKGAMLDSLIASKFKNV